MLMRIRSVNPSFYLHRRLFDAERETGLPLRIFFEGLWSASDREGRFPWSEDLKSVIIPYDDAGAMQCLQALLDRRFITTYWHKGKQYGVVPSMKRWQPINNRESSSRLPDPVLADGVESSRSPMDPETLSLALGDTQKPARSKPRARSATPEAPKTQPSWSYRACYLYEEKFGSCTIGGKIGKFLKPLITKFGEDDVLAAWALYLEHKEPQFVQPADFASHYAIWTPEGYALQQKRFNGAKRGVPKSFDYKPSDDLPPEQD